MYRDNITFLVDENHCFMESMFPQKFWLTEFGYEISAKECLMYVDKIHKIQVDLMKDKFGTYEEII